MTKKKKPTSTKNVLLEHSKAKVELLSTYLSTYLDIISRVKYIDRIHVYDLLCGEGKYENDSEGSPIAIIKTIKNHYFSNNNSCPNIDLWLNDNGKSDVEPTKTKIERVREFSNDIFKPDNVDIKFTEIDYEKIYNPVLERIKNFDRDKHLIFIDPHGYKNIKLNQLVDFLSLGNSELILFLPLFDMYRFANKSYDEEFKGGNALRKFLKDCFDNNIIKFNSVFDFSDKLKQGFIDKTDCFVDTFLLEKDKGNYYGLFFFTPNALGFQKMLEAKWKVDTEQGRGFSKRIENQTLLFGNLESSNYPYELKVFLKKKPRTNGEVYIFGLEKGYLPKHTIEVLRPERKNNNLIIKDLLGNLAPENAYYISYKNYKSNPVKEVIFYLK